MIDYSKTGAVLVGNGVAYMAVMKYLEISSGIRWRQGQLPTEWAPEHALDGYTIICMQFVQMQGSIFTVYRNYSSEWRLSCASYSREAEFSASGTVTVDDFFDARIDWVV